MARTLISNLKLYNVKQMILGYNGPTFEIPNYLYKSIVGNKFM
jgi:hypothetical protein